MSSSSSSNSSKHSESSKVGDENIGNSLYKNAKLSVRPKSRIKSQKRKSSTNENSDNDISYEDLVKYAISVQNHSEEQENVEALHDEEEYNENLQCDFADCLEVDKSKDGSLCECLTEESDFTISTFHHCEAHRKILNPLIQQVFKSSVFIYDTITNSMEKRISIHVEWLQKYIQQALYFYECVRKIYTTEVTLGEDVSIFLKKWRIIKSNEIKAELIEKASSIFTVFNQIKKRVDFPHMVLDLENLYLLDLIAIQSNINDYVYGAREIMTDHDMSMSCTKVTEKLDECAKQTINLQVIIKQVQQVIGELKMFYAANKQMYIEFYNEILIFAQARGLDPYKMDFLQNLLTDRSIASKSNSEENCNN